MKAELFEAIALRLKEKMNTTVLKSTYGPLNYIARFRNQFEDPNEALPRLAVAIEFSEIRFETQSKLIQEATFEVRIHCYNASLKKQKMGLTEVEGLATLQYLAEINKALQGWKPDCFSTMIRKQEIDDVTYDNKLKDIIVYEIMAVDRSADKRNDQVDAEFVLEVEPTQENLTPEPDDSFDIETR